MTSAAKTIIGRGFMIVLKRISWRIQPVEQIRKRKQRRREMWQRHEKFAEYVERVKKKRRADNGRLEAEQEHDREGK